MGPGAKVMEISDGYKLQEVEGNLLLKRPNGYVLAAFAAEVDFDPAAVDDRGDDRLEQLGFGWGSSKVRD